MYTMWGYMMRTHRYRSLRAGGRDLLHEIVREIVRTHGLGRDMTEDQTVAAAIELIEVGYARLEHDPDRDEYRLMLTEVAP